jgi:hypothetical protein
MSVHVVSILDRSGSMGGTEKEVIGAYNAFIKEQSNIAQTTNTKIKLTLVLFDNQVETVYSKILVNQVPELDDKTYFVRGMTALYDAIGKTIQSFEGKDKVIFFIETDGAENSSREFTHSTLKSLVDKKTADGWDFNFVGADLSKDVTASMAQGIGIAAGKTMAFDKTSAGYTSRNAMYKYATMSYVATPIAKTDAN